MLLVFVIKLNSYDYISFFMPGAIFFVCCCFHFQINRFQNYCEMRTEVLVSLFVLMANAIVNMLNINISSVAHQFAIGSCKPGSAI